ncbi:uncharacterized protein LOC110247895 [Exaiptasia diaphana]|uniref:Uncharacterized protein n=1 Tax=Exaiptasia diaphana TaxID=2652724 RepID=A0A913XUL1_EXADI|nr:uncharacterized protein LOC110247895 [Exaiptasia diaphana]
MKLTISALLILGVAVSALAIPVKRSEDDNGVFPDSRFEVGRDLQLERRCLSMSCGIYQKLRLGSRRGNRKSRFGSFRKFYSSRRKSRARDNISNIDRRMLEDYLSKMSHQDQ